MIELNNLKGALGDFDSDLNILKRQAKPIKEFIETNEWTFHKYIQGLIMCAMEEFYDDMEIAEILDCVNTVMDTKQPHQILIYEHTHKLELED